MEEPRVHEVTEFSELADFTIINFNPEDLTDLQPRACRLKAIAKGVFGVIAETVEGGAIGYAIYLVPANLESLDGMWGYGLVAAGATLSGAVETLKHLPINRSIRRLEYNTFENNPSPLSRLLSKSERALRSTHVWIVNHNHPYHITLESLVGGLIIGNYFSQLAPTQASQLAIDASVTLGATGFHLVAKALEHHKKLPPLLRYPFYTVFGGALGFGLGTELLDNIEGFGVNVPTWAKWFTLSAVAAPNIYAQIARNKSGKVMRSSFYGMSIAAFFAILAFDMIQDITNSNDISNVTFGMVYTIAVFLSVSSMLAHYHDDLHNQASHEHDFFEDGQPHEFLADNNHVVERIEILEENILEQNAELTLDEASKSIPPGQEIRQEEAGFIDTTRLLSDSLTKTLHSATEQKADLVRPSTEMISSEDSITEESNERITSTTPKKTDTL